MKSLSLFRCLCFVALMGFGVTAQAQQWYHVELVVFELLNPSDNEQSPIFTLQDPAPLRVGMANKAIQPADNKNLGNIAQRLRNSAGYRVVTHQSWQQAVGNRNTAQAVAIESDRVKGQVRFHIATYLHANLDLWLQDGMQSVESDSFHTLHQPRLVEMRRIRSKQVHYFDHPRFGAILQLIPVSTPDQVLSNMTGPETYSLPAEGEATTAE
ncbi:CsiV family protein [Methylophaga pinxianii]|uniref:CsiV family protein n=1 Tax=Methylophaga pinxianii TaxID=2881052 RepID=UPI001CF11A32|nr:CsiV family protein [Methylophaga pinxianii]MCB2428335.1 peptidoglycan binding protein CsiV [Methylophaga pinxianii]UPH45272.1 peptidoglycan binding protein CsiV [Methylophaga pinxianii]